MKVKVISLPAGEDPDSFINKNSVTAFKELIDNALSLFEFKFRLLKRQLKDGSLDSKVKLARQLLPTIKKVVDPILQAELIEDLSRRLNLNINALFTALKQLDKRNSSTFTKLDNIRDLSRQFKPGEIIEQTLLVFALQSEHYANLIKDNIKCEDFNNENVREVMQLLYKLLDEDHWLELKYLLNKFSEPLKIFVLDIINKIGLEQYDQQLLPQIFDDCIIRMKQNILRGEKKVIEGQIKAAQIQGDMNKVRTLLKQLNLLTKYTEQKVIVTNM
jgi:DNA primase